MNHPAKTYPLILLVDDEPAILVSIDTTLQMAGLNHILTCSDSREVPAILEEQPVDIILMDLNMPHLGGEDLLSRIAREKPDIPIIIVTGAMDVETAVRCMQSGAFDYVVKPVDEGRLISSVTRASSYRELQLENRSLRERLLSDKLTQPEAFRAIVTRNKKMQVIFQYVESIAQTSHPVLISGETGVGKELIARALHTLSGLDGDFVAVNVAGLDDNVFSDTLFGHTRGAFTGAEQDRSGLIERASGGTLFLDEIGDLSPMSQVKLLRLLQEGEYLPLGRDEVDHSDARIVASTHADLWTLEKEDRFRTDLIYRLSTHNIQIPSLRERIDDIPPLVDHFLEKAATSLGKKAPTTPPELFTLLSNHTFPGNIRELEAMVYDAVTRHSSGVLSMAVFRENMARMQSPAESLQSTGDGSANEIIFPAVLPTIQQTTHLLVEEAMRRTEGNQTQAARLLGVSQQALSKRLKAK
jgi:DNA-binding NtrC family response regulator